MAAVDLRVGDERGAFLVAELAAYLRGDSRDQRTIRYLCPPEDHSPAGDQATLSDHRTAEYDRPHSDQRTVADDAAVHDRVVPDRDVLPDPHRVSAVHVHGHVVLHIAALAEDDSIRVSAQHSVVPDARTALERHLP